MVVKPAVIPSELSSTPSATLVSLSVQLDLSKAAETYSSQIDSISANFRASCYLATAQIFLKSNATLERKLEVQDVKERLLGHFGTTGGINLIYTHLNALIARNEDNLKRKESFIFVCGPGHGAPALLAELFLEGTISHFTSKYDQTKAGVERFVRDFSWPGGNPSHVNAETPGAIHEGGELGYALSVAYGSVMDSPDLITVVLVGDGEAESGPTAAAWHAHKYIDPAESGAVLPVLHLNGFKISERTITGCMDETELAMLFTGYGYQVRFVDYVSDATPAMGGDDPADRAIHLNLAASMDWAYAEIRRIQAAARSGKPLDKPRFPLLILRTPKGMTGPVSTPKGNQLLDSWASHQVPLPAPRTDSKELDLLQEWLASYEPAKFFDLDAPEGSSIISSLVTDCLSLNVNLRVGMAKEAYANFKPLVLGDWKKFGDKQGSEVSAMKALGNYLKDTIEKNPHTFRIFSPDELTSNKLDAVFDVTTRNFQPDAESAHRGGRVIEMLSEHTLQGFCQGYILTGRHAVFPSYESFLGIISTMLLQYAKFAKMAQETSWRRDIAAITYIETSTWTRQEHNGFSHQNPSFIATVIGLPTKLARVYFPADANSTLSVIAHCLRSVNYVNLIVGSKNPTQNWLSIEEAEKHCIAGASVWPRFSIDNGVNPDVVLVGVGVETTFEVIAAAAILKKDFGQRLRVRVVNVVDLLVFAPVGDHPHAFDEASFNSIFPPGVPVIVNYHGNPPQIQSLLFNRPHSVGRSRFEISGYIEQGTTTTPFSMLRVNGCGRFDLAASALRKVVVNFTQMDNISREDATRVGSVVAEAHSFIAGYLHQNQQARKYAEATQLDHPSLTEIPSFD